MKTTIDIPEKELKDAIRFTGAATKREAVVTALKDFNRRKRIATGSGTSVSEVNRLLKQFTQTKKVLKKLGSGPMMQGLPPGLGR